MTTFGDMVYENNTPTPVRLSGNTTATKMYLSQTGNGVTSAAPVWLQPAFGDLSGTASLTSQVSGTLGVGNGGLGITNPTIHSLLLGEGTSATSNTGAGTAGQIIVSGGASADPTWSSLLTATGGQVSIPSLTTAGVLLNNGSGTISSSAGALSISNGGTGVTSVTTSPTASSFVGWDTNKNLSANNHLNGYVTTATAAGTTTLTVGSSAQQYFTGSTTQTVALPVATTLANGQSFQIVNLSSGIVTVQTSGANTVQAMAANTVLNITCSNTSGGTGLASWTWNYSSANTNVLPSASSSGKNYLTTYKGNTGNGDFEQASTNGWSLGTMGTLTNGLPTGTPTFGSGASVNLSISTVNSGQLAGAYSLSYVSSAATTAGNMLASSAFAIDTEDQSKVMTVKFYYSAPSNPANDNWSGTSSNSFAWAAYDVTNSVWLPSTGNFCMTQSYGIGYCTGTVQTGSSTASIRLVMYNANATSGATTLYLDDFFFGPQTAPMGPAMTDWVAYTPTFVGFGTVTNIAVYSRRVGMNLEVQGQFQAGTTTATTATMTLGYGGGNANVSMNSSYLPNSTVIGEATIGQASTTYFGAYIIAPSSSGTVVNFGVQTSAANALSAASGTGAATNAYITFKFSVPIVGWSSNSNVSSDTDTRVVAFAVAGSTTTSATNSSYVVAQAGATTTVNTHGTYNGSTTYTIPVTGVYESSTVISTGATVGTKNAYLYKNGASVGQFSTGTAAAYAGISGSVLFSANAGDTINVEYYNQSGSTETWYLLDWSVKRLSGPAVIAATESVNANYQTSAGQNISNNTSTEVVFATKNFDSHNAMNTSTGTYTVPVSGKYQVSASFYYSTAITATATDTHIELWKNGSIYQAVNNPKSGTTAAPLSVSGTFLVQCNAGDTLQINALQNSGSAQTLASSGAYNWMAIERVGN